MEDLVLQLGCALGVLLVGSFHVCFVLSHDGDEHEVWLSKEVSKSFELSQS